MEPWGNLGASWKLEAVLGSRDYLGFLEGIVSKRGVGRLRGVYRDSVKLNLANKDYFQKLPLGGLQTFWALSRGRQKGFCASAVAFV